MDFLTYIGIDCIKTIFYYSNHKDLTNWRLVNKTFKYLIDNLEFPNIDIFSACENGYYLVVKKLLPTLNNWEEAFWCLCKSKDINLIKIFINIILNQDIDKLKNSIYKNV